jgi:hypothetical protein
MIVNAYKDIDQFLDEISWNRIYNPKIKLFQEEEEEEEEELFIFCRKEDREVVNCFFAEALDLLEFA